MNKTRARFVFGLDATTSPSEIGTPSPEAASTTFPTKKLDNTGDIRANSSPRAPVRIKLAMATKYDDEDEVCAICQTGDFTDDNLIVFCEGKCKLGFHQKCYGILKIPPGEEPWYCDLCKNGCSDTIYRRDLYCCHYKNDKTARKLIVNGKNGPEYHFVHVPCAVCIPNVNTSSIPFTTSVPKLKAELTKCYFCGARYGFQVRCCYGIRDGQQCETTFHPMCAFRNHNLVLPISYNSSLTNFLCPQHDNINAIRIPKKRRRTISVLDSLASIKAPSHRQSLPLDSDSEAVNGEQADTTLASGSISKKTKLNLRSNDGHKKERLSAAGSYQDDRAGARPDGAPASRNYELHEGTAGSDHGSSANDTDFTDDFPRRGRSRNPHSTPSSAFAMDEPAEAKDRSRISLRLRASEGADADMPKKEPRKLILNLSGPKENGTAKQASSGRDDSHSDEGIHSVENHQSHPPHGSQKSVSPAPHDGEIPRVMSSTSLSKRPPIRIRPFVQGGGTYEQGGAVNAKLSEEQAKWIKDSHGMLVKQGEMLEKIHDAVASLSAAAAADAAKQKTQSTISNISSLTALISNVTSGNSNNNTREHQLQNSLSAMAGLDAHNGDSLSLARTASHPDRATPAETQIPFSMSAQPQLPRPALSISQLYGSRESEKLVPADTSLNSNKTGSSKGPWQPSLPQDGAAITNGNMDEGSAKAELHELKNNILELFKLIGLSHLLIERFKSRVEPNSEEGKHRDNESVTNGNSVIGGLVSSGGNGNNSKSLMTLIGDLKKMGMISQDNVGDYIKAILRNLGDK